MRDEYINLLSLGQVGFQLKYSHVTIYIDPYLSNSVQERVADDLVRLVPVPIQPNEVTDANYILITHAHLDHCDPDTLISISKASPVCIFVCPQCVRRILLVWGIPDTRIVPCLTEKVVLGDDLTVFPVPAAHPTIVEDREGGWESIGFVIEWSGRRIYHAGDTAVDQEIMNKINKIGSVDVAFLPVNEQNYYRNQRGIIGNMSIREAFQMAVDIGAKTVIPMHWDMFSANQVYREEIEVVYSGMSPPFDLVFYPDHI